MHNSLRHWNFHTPHLKPILAHLHSTHVKIMVSVLITLFMGIVGFMTVSNSVALQSLKRDLAEINHIKYGLFSVDEWKMKISTIVKTEINGLYITPENQQELKKHVERQLVVLIDKINAKIKAGNKGFSGKIRQAVMNVFIDIDDIKEGVPGYADAVLNEVAREKNQRGLKQIVSKRVDQYMQKTFDAQDKTLLDRIVKERHFSSVESGRQELTKQIAQKELISSQMSWAMIGLALALVLLAVGGTSLPASHFILCLLGLTLLLVVGVSTPMIDLEAKISELSFSLLGHPVVFKDQVLYFQSKSILDVFWIMLTHKDIEMKLVGVLIASFSIVFPVLKLFSSLAYYYGKGSGPWRSLVEFFVLKSGKWSMADVMVVGIFMAFIGFNGIVSAQFGVLSSKVQDMVLLTTNGTALKPGYYLFTAYALLSIALSLKLARFKKPRAQSTD